MADDEQPTVVPVAAPRGTKILVGVIVAIVGFGGLVAGAARVAPEPPRDAAAATAPSITPARSRDVYTPAPPEWAVTLGASLECQGKRQALGGELGSFEPVHGLDAPVPYEWLDSIEGAALPLTGWRQDPVVPWYGEDGYVRYVHVAAGRVAAAIVMAGTSTNTRRATWSVVAVRACPPDEFDPAALRTTDDDPWTLLDRSAGEIDVARGDASCGWDGVIVLRNGDRGFVRDPARALPPDAVAGGFESGSFAPPDAVRVARSIDRELLVSAADPSAVWVRVGEIVERWPRAIEEIGCA